jgi:hypothetical protein
VLKRTETVQRNDAYCMHAFQLFKKELCILSDSPLYMSMFSLWLVNGVHFLKRRTGHFCLGLMATEKHYKSDSNSVVHYVYTWGTPRKK